MYPTFNSRLKDAGARSVIWAFVGALFGVLFVGALQPFEEVGGPIDPLIFAAACAGAVGALIYSSMRLAVITAGVSTVLIVVLQFARGIGSVRVAAWTDLAVWLGAAVAVGAVVGAYYGHVSPASRVNRAMGKTLAGLAAGGATGVVWWAVVQLSGSAPPLWLTVGVLVPVVGWSYVLLANQLLRSGGRWLPRAVDGALVGATVACVVVLGYWVVAAGVSPAVAGAAGFDRTLMAQLPEALVAGAGGGMLAGFVRGLLGFGWYDL
jgi:hypothetical protein